MKDSSYILVPRGFDELSSDIKDIRKPMFKRLYEQCNVHRKENLPEEHPMKSITYFGMAAANLSMAYKLTGQKHYLDEAKRWLFRGVSFEHWGRAVKVDVDLSAAWLLFGFGLSYNWLKDDLTPDERASLREKLILQGERMYKYAIETEGTSWSTEYWQNHNWIDYACLATAGYAIMDEYPDAKVWTEKAKSNFHKVIPLLADDGSDYEGIAYWRYGVIWLIIYSDLLRDREGIDLFKQSSFLENTFYYRLYQAAPNLEQTVNFGDCHDRQSGHSIAVYYKLASEYKLGHAQYLAEFVSKNVIWREGYDSGIKPGILPEAFLELLWFDPSVESKDFKDLPLVKYFKDLGLVVMKNGWHEDAIQLAFKASPGGGHKQWSKSFELDKENGWRTRSAGHHHPDSNSFILIGYDSYLAIDDGYNKQKMALDHNLVLVDDKGYIGDGNYDVYRGLPEDATAEIEEFALNENYVFVVGESSKIYNKELKLNRFARNILNTGEPYFIMIDELSSSEPHKYTWQMHSDVWSEAIDKSTFEIANGKGILTVANLEPEEANSFSRETKVIANPTSQEPSLIIEQNMKTLCIENKIPSKDMRFVNVLGVNSIFEKDKILVTQENNKGFKLIKIFYMNQDEIIIWNDSQEVIDVSFTLINKQVFHIKGDGKWISLKFKDGLFISGAAYKSKSIELEGVQRLNKTNSANELHVF